MTRPSLEFLGGPDDGSTVTYTGPAHGRRGYATPTLRKVDGKPVTGRWIACWEPAPGRRGPVHDDCGRKGCPGRKAAT